MNLIKLLTAESQSNIKVFNLIKDFYLIISDDNWLQKYIYWELELLKILGYDLEFSSLVTKNVDNKILYAVKSSTEKKIVPNFLIDKTIC